MTEEIKKAILEDYKNRNIKVHDIYKKYKINRRTLNNMLDETETPHRCPNKVGSRDKKIKACPNCHRKTDIKGAKFCCFCGADIRDERDLAIEKIQRLYQSLMLLPASSRDEAQQIIKDIENYLRKG